MTLSADEVIALCTRKSTPVKPKHLNVRLSREDATIYDQLCAMTPGMSDSRRIKDSVRTSTYLLAAGDPVLKKLNTFGA